MTIYEIYDKNIKDLPFGDRLRLARLILEEAAPDEPMTPGEAQAHLNQLVKNAYDSGPLIPWTSEDVERIKQEVRASSDRRHASRHA